MKVTLTFDNGPEPSVTPHVLSTLESKAVLATFFVLGSKISTQEGYALALAAARAGHRIGNHTYSHTTPFGELQDGSEAVREIASTQKLIGALACSPPLFRPFGKGGAIGRHLLNNAALAELERGGYTMALWNSVPRDWDDPEGWLERAVGHCLAQDWTVMVLHDLPTGAMERLSELIDRLRDAGAQFQQELPLSCTPILAGAPIADLSGLLNCGGLPPPTDLSVHGAPCAIAPET